MRIPYLLIFQLCFIKSVQCQVPASAIAFEDTAFNSTYASRTIPVISGKLLNLSADELKNLTITYTLVTPFSQWQKKKTVSPQPDGRFRLELDYAFPYQQIWFALGDLFYTGLYADKDLYLELDVKKIKAAKTVYFNGDGVRYLGTDGPLNVYLSNYALYKRPQQQQLSGKISQLVFSATSADSILPNYNKLFDSLKQIEDSYIYLNNPSYSWLLKNERMSEYYSQICTLYFGRMMEDSILQKIKQHKSYLMSNRSAFLYSYLVMYLNSQPSVRVSTSWKDVAALTDLDQAEKAVIDSLRASEKIQPAYPSYTPENIKKWSDQLQPRIQKIALIRSLDRNIQQIDSLFPPEKADFLKLHLNSSSDVAEQKLALEHILASMHTDWCRDVVRKEYQQTSDKMEEINKALAKSGNGSQQTSFGKPMLETSFGASLFKASGIKALDFLAKLKESFPGKAIIIDRWATWCAPCLAEMAHSKKLQEDSKDLPVIFIYLCTVSGSTEAKWKSKLVELEQPGVHILIDETLDDDISNYFSFSGYPGYALIDKTGHYRPDAIKRMSEIESKEALVALISH